MKKLAAALLMLPLLVGVADAKKRQTFCQKAVKAERAKVLSKQNGVTVYRRGQVFSACSDARRHTVGINAADPGVKLKLARASSSRCVVALFTGGKELPRLAFKDLAEKDGTVTQQIVGFGNPSASVGSVAVSKNCAAAWGQSVNDGAATSYGIHVHGFSNSTAVVRGDTTVATVNSADDTKHVGITAVGRKVTVKWTEAGTVKRSTLP